MQIRLPTAIMSTKLLAVLLCALAGCASAASHTHVDNRLNTEVVATLSYIGGSSKFQNRHIPAGGSGTPPQLHQMCATGPHSCAHNCN